MFTISASHPGPAEGRHSPHRQLLAALFCVTTFGPALAARPLATEDAAVQPQSSCEVDSYAGRLKPGDEGAIRSLQTQISCGIGWRTQLALGYSDVRKHDGMKTRAWMFSGKTMLTEPRDDDAGLSLVYGAPAEQEAGSATRWGDGYLTLAGSLPIADRVQLHLNLGWTGSHKKSPSTTSWAVALDDAYSESLHVVAETFADDHDHRPWVQFGAAQSVNEHVSFNVSYGHQARRGNAQAITLGFVVGF